MNPNGTMTRNAVKQHPTLVEGLLNFLGAFEEFPPLKHVIRRLRTGRSGALGVIKKVRQVLRAVLGAFDGRMETILRHNFVFGWAVGLQRFPRDCNRKPRKVDETTRTRY